MKNSFIHKTCSLLLVLSFCLFSIGVPILIGACPMTSSAHGDHACCLQKNIDHRQMIHPVINTACCKAGSIAAERNTTEFLQSNEYQAHAVSCVLFMMESSNAVPIFDFSVTHRSYHSPPPAVNDIPIRISSLLL